MGKIRYNWDLIAANLLFGANFSILVALVRSGIDFRTLFIWQVVVGALFFVPSALLSPRTYRIAWRDLGRMAGVSVLVIYGWMYLLLWGSTYTNPIDSAIIATLGPSLTLLMDRLLHRGERFNRSRLIGLGATFLGAWLLIFDKGFQLTRGTAAWGNLLVLGAVVAIAANTVLIKPTLERLGTRVVMGWYYFIGLAIALPHFGHRLNIDELLRLPLLVQGDLAYLLLFGTVWPMWLLYRGAEHLTATHTALYRYIQPLIAGTLAHLRHQAHFDRTNLTALVLIFVGILLTVIGYRRSVQAIRESLAPRRFRQRR